MCHMKYLLTLCGFSTVYTLKILNLIIASDNLEIYKKEQELWRQYMHTDPDIESYFIKSKELSGGDVLVKGDTIWVNGNERLYAGRVKYTPKNIPIPLHLKKKFVEGSGYVVSKKVAKILFEKGYEQLIESRYADDVSVGELLKTEDVKWLHFPYVMITMDSQWDSFLKKEEHRAFHYRLRRGGFRNYHQRKRNAVEQMKELYCMRTLIKMVYGKS